MPVLLMNLHRLRRALGVDRAVGFTILARSWSIAGGLVNILLIARLLSPAGQGYYYTFASLVQLQTVFELGFSFVVLQLAAHETAHLKIGADGTITGSEVAHSRLASILQKSVRWYSIAAILMVIGLLSAGLRFFSTHQHPEESVAWKLPWICVAIATTLTFQMDPIFSFLEGCGFVSNVARLRLRQAIAGSLLAWSAFLLHRGLYAPACLIMGQAVMGLFFLISNQRLLLSLLRHRTRGSSISWTHEIWPFQWRIAVSFLCGYFILPLFNPVLFAYRGATEAGRMGMSITIATALGTVAYSWVNTKTSPFGNMIARQEYIALDGVFFTVVRQSAGFLFIAETGVLILLVFAKSHFPHLASRVLSIPLFAIILLTSFLLHLVFCEAAYLRAHKREPFLILSILVACLTAASTILAGRCWGAAGMTIGYFIWGGIFQLAFGTYIFTRSRREWHGTTKKLDLTNSRYF
ncbi:MAG TPA: hypothetical protein VHB45_13215 [Alloacidobacterium sp.]|nr:hypothetical protein [Alloacidobacterium sp.]